MEVKEFIMKKVLLAVATTVLIAFAVIRPSAQDIVVEVDGVSVDFEQPPVIIDGRTLVPMRAVFEALGAEVDWNGDTSTAFAVKGDTVISIGINDKNITVNGNISELDVSACIINDRTMVPARAVSEAFGYSVDWDGERKAVIISTGTFGLEIHYIDVGQADCALIMCGGENMLIDGGNVADSSTVVAYLKKQSVDYLDYILCTHAHEDHVGGLSGALAVFDVGTVYAPTTGSGSNAYKNFVRKANEQGLEPVSPNTHDKISLGNSTVEFYVPSYEDADLNNTSVMCKVSYGNTSFLFTGDAEKDEEKDIINQGADLDADVLKVGHHGSDSSSSYVFLREVMPEFAVISVGEDNSYGHPSADVLSRLADADVSVYRTDLCGDIVAASDGNNISFSTSKQTKKDQVQTMQAQQQSESQVPNQTKVQAQTGMYIGNKKSKKLHTENCGSLPKEENREYFEKRDDAILQGYEPCGNCCP